MPSQFASDGRSPRIKYREHGDQHHAELVDGGDLRRVAELEGAEIAHP
jgi:hypothetical protein